jgi:hypothetical protein
MSVKLHRDNKIINRNTRQNKQENKDKKQHTIQGDQKVSAQQISVL